MTNLKLGIIELYWPRIHGELEENDNHIHYHYIVSEIIPKYLLKRNFYNKKAVKEIPLYYKNHYNKYINLNNGWSTVCRYPNLHITNFECIVSNNDYFQYHIIKPYLLDSYHSIAIIKTYFIRIIQRVWKKLYKKRKEIYNERNKYCNIEYKNTNGEWPKHCNDFPSARGILYNI